MDMDTAVTMAVATKKVRCPSCGKLCDYSSENSFRPFCSERCQLIDLGQWASEKYKIETQERGATDSPPQEDGEAPDERRRS